MDLSIAQIPQFGFINNMILISLMLKNWKYSYDKSLMTILNLAMDQLLSAHLLALAYYKCLIKFLPRNLHPIGTALL